MCRLFGQLSLQPSDALEGMSGAPYSLIKLSRAEKKRLQKDGWGVGWFDAAGRPRVVKSARPLYAEEGKALRAAKAARSRAVIGHVRAASNPRGWAKRRILGVSNNQPFTDGRWLFAHNGTLEIVDEVAELLGAHGKRLAGSNDSEVFFRQFLKFLDAYGEPATALAACARETVHVWRACRRRHPRKDRPFTGLNAVVSDGRTLHALSLYPSRRGLRSLGRREQDWGTMSLRTDGRRAVVASEDQDGGRWRRLGPGTLVSVSISGGRLRARVRPAGAGVLP